MDSIFDDENFLEGIDLEAKKAGGKDGKGQLPNDVWETYSSFSNTRGGAIFLGVIEHKDGTLGALGIEGILVPHGRGRATTYCVKGYDTVDLVSLAASSKHVGSSSEHLEPTSEHLPATSEHLDPTEDPELLAIAQEIRESGKASPTLVNETIINLCEGRFLTINQIAKLRGRSPDGIRQRYIKPLVASEKLNRRYPHNPHYEDQAYTSSAR